MRDLTLCRRASNPASSASSASSCQGHSDQPRPYHHLLLPPNDKVRKQLSLLALQLCYRYLVRESHLSLHMIILGCCGAIQSSAYFPVMTRVNIHLHKGTHAKTRRTAEAAFVPPFMLRGFWSGMVDVSPILLNEGLASTPAV